MEKRADQFQAAAGLLGVPAIVPQKGERGRRQWAGRGQSTPIKRMSFLANGLYLTSSLGATSTHACRRRITWSRLTAASQFLSPAPDTPSCTPIRPRAGGPSIMSQPRQWIPRVPHPANSRPRENRLGSFSTARDQAFKINIQADWSHLFSCQQ